MSAACAMRDHWLAQLPEDGDEGSAIVSYAGVMLTVYYTVYDDGVRIDGIEYAGLTLDADDLSDQMLPDLTAGVRTGWDSEVDHAPV